MRVKELFSGSGILSEIFREKGHESITVDNFFKADIKKDVLLMTKEEVYGFDVLHASPPCDTYSVASIGTHWKGGKEAYIPKTQKCEDALKLLDHLIYLIAEGLKNNPNLIWSIENPRGVMRKIIGKLFEKHKLSDYVRHTVTYCQYGEKRMKPTDWFTNNPSWIPRPICKNGDPCHVAAPRGSRTGTQGLKDAYERGTLPKELCIEIVEACEKQMGAKQ